MTVVTSRSCRSQRAVRVVRAGGRPDSCRILRDSSGITSWDEAAVRVVGAGGRGDSCRPLGLTDCQAHQHTGGQLAGRRRISVSIFLSEIETLTILTNILRQTEMTELSSQQQQYL